MSAKIFYVKLKFGDFILRNAHRHDNEIAFLAMKNAPSITQLAHQNLWLTYVRGEI